MIVHPSPPEAELVALRKPVAEATLLQVLRRLLDAPLPIRGESRGDDE